MQKNYLFMQNAIELMYDVSFSTKCVKSER
jgi:hypothetical protein